MLGLEHEAVCGSIQRRFLALLCVALSCRRSVLFMAPTASCAQQPPASHPLPRFRGAQLEEAEARTSETVAQKDAALAATASGSQQAEQLAAQATARADELRQKLDEAQATAAAAAAEAEDEASRTIGELRESLAAVEAKLGEAEERALAGAGARAEEEETKAQGLRKELERSEAERAEVRWPK